MFKNEDYINWGKELFEKAKNINRYEIQYKTKVVQIIEDIKKKYDLSDKIANGLAEVGFRSFAMKGYFPGPEEVKDYWLDYIAKNPYNFQYTSWEDSIRKMIEGPFRGQIMNNFQKHHFSEDGKFSLTWGGDRKINIRVPYTLNYYEVKYAIDVIEKLTHCEVTKISLWYFTYDIFVANMYSEVVMAVDDDPDKHEGHPFIPKNEFLNFKFSSYESWFREIPEFKEYVNQIDYNTFECQSCGSSHFYSPDLHQSWHCHDCNHYIDRQGKCISDCNCQKDDTPQDDLPF